VTSVLSFWCRSVAFRSTPLLVKIKVLRLLFGFKQYGRIGLLINLMAVIVVFRFLMSASVDTPDSHRAFSVRPTANTPSANLIPRLWVGSSFFNTALDAKP
jgi:hypothetical protein